MYASLDHVVFRYTRHVLCILFAGAMVVVSGLANIESAPWLLAFYITVISLFATIRRLREGRAPDPPMLRSFAVYLAFQSGYLLSVWMHYVMVPGVNPAKTAQLLISYSGYAFQGGIGNSVAHFAFVRRFAGVRSRALKLLEWLGWCAAGILSVALLTGNMVKEEKWTGHSWVPLMSPMYIALFYLVSFFLTIGVIVPAVKMFTTDDRNRRMQLFFYTIGVAPAWATCWMHFLISMGLRIYPVGGIMFLLHAAIIAFAVLQYRAFPVTLRIRRNFAYAAGSVLIGAAYLVVLAGLWSFGPQTSATFYVRTIFVVLLVFVYAPLFAWLQKSLDSFFFRSSVDREQLIDTFVREASSTLDLFQISKSLCETIHSGLKLRSIDLYLRPAGQDQFLLFGAHDHAFVREDWPKSRPLPEDFTRLLSQQSAPQRVKLERRGSDGGVPFQFDTGDEALLIPILKGEERLGCILIGPKFADEPFAQEDIRFCETLAASSSSVLQNARSYLQIKRLQRVNEGILFSLSAGVLLLTESEEIVSANRAARQICETADQFPDRLSKLWELQPILASAIKRAIKERDMRQNDELALEGQRKACVLFSISALNLDDAEGTYAISTVEMAYVVVLHDITEYKQMKAMAERNESLARLGEVAAGINHEIRNLLQPIRHRIDRLTQVDTGNPAAVNEELERASAVIPDRLRALEKMLGNLKNLGRPLDLRIRPVELESLAAAVWREIGETPAAAGIAFKLEISAEAREVSADGSWLRQAIYNLLQNAAEAAADCREPRISLMASRSGQIYTIRVCDNGRGIDEPARKRLFEPFFSSKGAAGTGLGLCVCRRIIESHGGRIAIENEPGDTVFRITLPQRDGASVLDELPR